MNSNFRKTALLLGACALLSWGYAPEAKAESNSVASVQQTKTVKAYGIRQNCSKRTWVCLMLWKTTQS